MHIAAIDTIRLPISLSTREARIRR